MTSSTTDRTAQPGRRPHRGGIVAALSAAAMLFAIGASTLEMYERRSDTLDSAALQAGNLALALANTATQSIASVESALAAAADAVPRVIERGRGEPDFVRTFLNSRVRATPEFSGLFVVDAAGMIVANSLGVAPKEAGVAARDFFPKTERERMEFRLAKPQREPVSGALAVLAIGPIRSTDGSFAGLLVGTIDPTRFERFYRNFEIGRTGRIELVTAEGEIVARIPADGDVLGQRSGAFGRIRTLPDGAQGRTVDHVAADGVRRIVAFRPVANTGLFVLVALGHDEALAGWRDELLAETLSTALVVVVIALLTLVVLGQFRSVYRAEAAHREQSRVLQAVFDSSADGIVVVDRDHRFAFLNPAAERITGISKDEVLGLTLDEMAGQRGARAIEILRPDGKTAIPQQDWPLSKLIRGEDIDDELFTFRRRPPAEPVVVAVSARQIRGEKGETLGAVEVLHDETVRRRLEAQLEQSRRVEALGQLTGGVAHDFNNLLLVILGNAEALERALGAQPELQRQARMIGDAGGRAADLTGRLLAFGRRQLLQPAEIAVNPLIENTVTMLQRVLGEHVAIVLHLDPAAAVVRADRSQLEVALLNLAVNARDAMPKGGTLTIETANAALDAAYAAANPDAAAGDYVMIAVSDTGSGMAPETIERAFEPFFTTKPVGVGTGLGLSSVHGFIRQSGGHVKLYSEPGRGTTVKLFLPRVAAVAPAAAPEPEADALPRGGESILLVEDDDLVRAHGATALAELGYRVVECANAKAALDLLDGGAVPDLLFTDMVMPGGMDGGELAAAVRKRFPDMPVLITSGYTQAAIGKALAADIHLLGKPYRIADLAAALRRALDRAPRATET